MIKIVVGLLLGWITGSIAIIVLTVLRFGIPMCNSLIKNKEEVEAVKLLKKKYFISLVVWLPVIILITFLCYKFLNNGFYGFVIAWGFMILIGFGSTGKTENNISDFNNSLNRNIDIVKNKQK